MTGHEIIQVYITGLDTPFTMRFSWARDRVIRPYFGKGVTRIVARALNENGKWEKTTDNGVVVRIYVRTPGLSSANVEAVLGRYEF